MKTLLLPILVVMLGLGGSANGQLRPSIVVAPSTNLFYVGDPVSFTFGGNPAGLRLKSALRLFNAEVQGPAGFSHRLTFTKDIAESLEKLTLEPALPGNYSMVWSAGTSGYPFHGSNGFTVLPRGLQLALDKEVVSLGESTRLTISGDGIDAAWFKSVESVQIESTGGGVVTSNRAGMFRITPQRPGTDTLRLSVRTRGGTELHAQATLKVVNPEFHLTVVPSETTVGDPTGIQFTTEILPAGATRYFAGPVRLTVTDRHDVTIWQTNLTQTGALHRTAWLPQETGQFTVHALLDGPPRLHAKAALQVRSHDLKLLASPGQIKAGGFTRLEVSSRLPNTGRWLSSVSSQCNLLHVRSGTTNPIPVDLHLCSAQPFTLSIPGLHRFILRTPGGIAETFVQVEEIADGVVTQEGKSLPIVPGVPFRITAPVPILPYRSVELGFVVDVTGSMADEIRSVQVAMVDIFSATQMLAPTVRAAIFSYSGKNNGPHENSLGFALRASMTTNAADLAGLRLPADGPGPEAPFASLHLAARSPVWSADSAKILLLLTDDIDHFYMSKTSRRPLATVNGTRYDEKRNWNHGNVSANEILADLKAKGFAVAGLISEDQVSGLTDEYARVFQQLGANAIGAYKLEAANLLTQQIGEAVKRMITQKATITLRERNLGPGVLTSIRPVEPASCIVEGVFSYQRLVESGVREIVFECIPGRRLPEGDGFLLEVTNEGAAVLWRQPIIRVPGR